jgi:hypothetical protein
MFHFSLKKTKNFEYYFKISSRNHPEVVDLQKTKSEMPSVGLQKEKIETLAKVSFRKQKNCNFEVYLRNSVQTPATRNYFTVSETETETSAGSPFLKKKTMKNVSKHS